MTGRYDRHRPVAAAFALGLVHALSFAPDPLPDWALPYVQVFSLAGLLYLALRAQTARQAAVRGFAFGIANFTLGLYWLYISMHEYGAMAAPLAGAGVVALSAFEAVFIALACALAFRVCAGWAAQPLYWRGSLQLAAVWASSWTLFEWLRGTLFTGFPWLNIAYAHVEGVLAPWAPVVGVYGVAWLAAFAAASIAALGHDKRRAKPEHTAPRFGAHAGVAMTLLIGMAGMGLSLASWSTPDGKPLIMRLVQGNVPQSMKFDPRHVEQGIRDYLALAAVAPQAPEGAPKIVVLPETVVPVFQDAVSESLWRQWLDVARQRDAHILMGIPLYEERNRQGRYTNSAIAFDAQTPMAGLRSGRLAMRYDKQHLVPFGEFIPPGFRWFVDAMEIPLGDFVRGPIRQPLFPIEGQHLSVNICYEDVFAEEIIQTVRDSDAKGPGASILVNISNLAWFGDSWALRQHLRIARMRALETARPMVRATNTGMTAYIGPKGQVYASLAPMTVGVLDVEVQGMTGYTPYVRMGNPPVLTWALAILLLSAWFRRRV
ncbi:MAG: apolipoprotein N-acyltransferase [Candidimonas sp.]